MTQDINAEMTTVKCSICNNDMECPADMAHADNHMCSVCVDALAAGYDEAGAKEIAAIERDVQNHKEEMMKLGRFIHDTSFRANIPPKNEAREMSKKELAEKMHLYGILTAIDFFMYSGLKGSDLKKILQSVEENNAHKPDFSDAENLQMLSHEVKNVIEITGAIGENLDRMQIKGKKFDTMKTYAEART